MSDLPDADRTGQPAIDYAHGTIGGTMPDSGLCLQYTRQDFAIPSLYASAIDAWNGAHDRHPDDRNVPPGVPAWFWSESIYRHVAFHLGGGVYATTYNEEIRSYGMTDMERIYGPFIGWAGDLNARDVLPAGTPVPPEPPWVDPWAPWKDDPDMPWFFRRNDGAIVIVGPTGCRTCTSDQWATYTNLGIAVFPPGMGAMDPAPFQQVLDSLGGLVEGATALDDVSLFKSAP